jgi:hypothetical protein
VDHLQQGGSVLDKQLGLNSDSTAATTAFSISKDLQTVTLSEQHPTIPLRIESEIVVPGVGVTPNVGTNASIVTAVEGRKGWSGTEQLSVFRGASGGALFLAATAIRRAGTKRTLTSGGRVHRDVGASSGSVRCRCGSHSSWGIGAASGQITAVRRAGGRGASAFLSNIALSYYITTDVVSGAQCNFTLLIGIAKNVITPCTDKCQSNRMRGAISIISAFGRRGRRGHTAARPGTGIGC